jgi:hypothetical protein
LAAWQDNDDELRTLLASNNAQRLEKQQIPGTTVSSYSATSAGKLRPYVPAPLRLQMFQLVHDLSLTGTSSSEAGRTAFRVAWHTEGLPHLGTGLPGLSAIKSLPPHSYCSGRFHTHQPVLFTST